MKTARYHKKCFDQIEGIVANKELTAKVDRLHQRLEATDHEKTVQEEPEPGHLAQ